GTIGLPEKEPIRRVAVFRRAGIRKLLEKRMERGQLRVGDLEPREHAAEVGAVIAVVEQADVPPPTQLLEELCERAGPLGKLEAVKRIAAVYREIATRSGP